VAAIPPLKPHFYLSTEWGVPFGSVSVGIPFYLARADLIALHAREVGFLEGAGSGDFLCSCYLGWRHCRGSAACAVIRDTAKAA